MLVYWYRKSITLPSLEWFGHLRSSFWWLPDFSPGWARCRRCDDKTRIMTGTISSKIFISAHYFNTSLLQHFFNYYQIFGAKKCYMYHFQILYIVLHSVVTSFGLVFIKSRVRPLLQGKKPQVFVQVLPVHCSNCMWKFRLYKTWSVDHLGKKKAWPQQNRGSVQQKYVSQKIMGIVRKWGLDLWTITTNYWRYTSFSVEPWFFGRKGKHSCRLNTFPPCIIELLNMKCFCFWRSHVWYIFTYIYHKKSATKCTYICHAIRGSCVDCFRRSDVLGKNKPFFQLETSGKAILPRDFYMDVVSEK